MRARRGFGPISALLLLTAAAHADGDPARGEQRFVDCAACHAPQPGVVANVGPSLQGVFRTQGRYPGGFPLLAGLEAQRHHLDGGNA